MSSRSDDSGSAGSCWRMGSGSDDGDSFGRWSTRHIRKIQRVKVRKKSRLKLGCRESTTWSGERVAIGNDVVE